MSRSLPASKCAARTHYRYCTAPWERCAAKAGHIVRLSHELNHRLLIYVA